MPVLIMLFGLFSYTSFVCLGFERSRVFLSLTTRANRVFVVLCVSESRPIASPPRKRAGWYLPAPACPCCPATPAPAPRRHTCRRPRPRHPRPELAPARLWRRRPTSCWTRTPASAGAGEAGRAPGERAPLGPASPS